MAKQMCEENLAEHVKLIELLTCLDRDFVFVSGGVVVLDGSLFLHRKEG